MTLLVARCQPQVPTTAEYEDLKAHFQPIFDEIASGAKDRELNGQRPVDQIEQLNAAGFSVLRVPKEYGGPGASVHTFIRLLIDLAAADSNIAHQYRSHYGFLEALRFADTKRKEYWYREVLQGTTVGNASTEIGNNALGTLNTQLRPSTPAVDGEPTNWTIDGEKYYATGSLYSTHTRVSASLQDAEGNVAPGRSFAVVPVDAEGVELEDDWDGFGQKLTATGTARFRNVSVDSIAVLPRTPGSAEAVHEAAFFQEVLLAVLAGIARAVRDDAAAGVRVRKRTFNTGLGLPYRQDPLIQETVGRIAATAFSVEATTLHAAATLDRSLDAAVAAGADRPEYDGELPSAMFEAEIAVEQAQVTVPEETVRVASELFLTGGASNTAVKKGLDRHWRNAQTVSTHNPIVFRARTIGDYYVNGTLPEGLNAIGDAKTGSSDEASAEGSSATNQDRVATR